MSQLLGIPTLLGVLLVGAQWGATGARAAGHDVEVGPAEWRRDFAGALEASRQSGKPVFAFFQEVPGCAGCKQFGAKVMSHPAIVRAVSEEFVPVLIYNNRGGTDAAVREFYGEPAWNYQVVRFLDGAGKDLIPRKDRVWTLVALATRMIEALEASGRSAPRYLEVAAYENDTAHLATAAFAQHCFWTGEVELGRIPGVISTEAGWIAGAEVTRVTYHTGLVSLESLVDQAAATDSALEVFLADDAERRRARAHGGMAVGKLDGRYRRADDTDQKRQIRNTPLFRPGLSPMQQTKANAFAPIDMQEARAWLD